MKRVKITICLAVMYVMVISNFASADMFGTGDNQFNIDFVPISGDTGNLGSWSAGYKYTFSGVNHGNYRMGTYEISNDQWTKFNANYGAITGSEIDPYDGSTAYDQSPYFPVLTVSTTCVSWYEAAQFVNYLNTSTNHQAAYKFTGTQGTSNYTFGVWQAGDTGYNADNPYRNSEAFYFMPTEDEWVKAAYWNGTNLQTYATIGDSIPVAGVDTNYDQDHPYDGPWNVGSGSEELNGTYNMMGNVYEWTESPNYTGNYLSDSGRFVRGGMYCDNVYGISLSYSLVVGAPLDEYSFVGFRVASVPEPCSLILLSLGGLALLRRKN